MILHSPEGRFRFFLAQGIRAPRRWRAYAWLRSLLAVLGI
jgi:hypothetical protein